MESYLDILISELYFNGFYKGYYLYILGDCVSSKNLLFLSYEHSLIILFLNVSDYFCSLLFSSFAKLLKNDFLYV